MQIGTVVFEASEKALRQREADNGRQLGVNWSTVGAETETAGSPRQATQSIYHTFCILMPTCCYLVTIYEEIERSFRNCGFVNSLLYTPLLISPARDHCSRHRGRHQERVYGKLPPLRYSQLG